MKNYYSILLVLFLSIPSACVAEPEQLEEGIRLHVIYSEKLQAIMHKLSLSVYEEELSLEQIDELFDNASELYVAAKELDQALPGIDLSYAEKNIFENLARQLQIEANNMGHMAEKNDKEGLQITYDRLSRTCAACHDLFRY